VESQELPVIAQESTKAQQEVAMLVLLLVRLASDQLLLNAVHVEILF